MTHIDTKGVIEKWEKDGMKSITHYPTISMFGYDMYMLTNVAEFIMYLPHFCHVKTNENLTTGPHEIYLLIDTPNHSSFGHFIFESSIYIHIYAKLKKIFDGIKILTVAPMKYKLLILNYFGVHANEIVTKFNSNNNVCFMPFFAHSSLNSNDGTEGFRRSLVTLYPIYNNYKYMNVTKDIDVMILPRHSAENNPSTERIIDTMDIENHLRKLPKCVVFDTSHVDTLNIQIEKIRRTDILIVPDGSSMLVNGFFAKNSIIIVLGFGTIKQANSDTPKLKYVQKYIASNNIVIFITNRIVIDSKHVKYTYDMIRHIIEKHRDIQFPCTQTDMDETEKQIVFPIIPETLKKLLTKFEENMFIDNQIE
jgi:hypothetical protein